MSDKKIIVTPGHTWAIYAQRDSFGAVFLAVVRADGRGADAVPVSPMVVLDQRQAHELALFCADTDELVSEFRFAGLTPNELIDAIAFAKTKGWRA